CGFRPHLKPLSQMDYVSRSGLIFLSGAFASTVPLNLLAMPHSTQFECPNCAAKYEVVRVEAPPGPTTDREITCLSCGGPLNGRQGPFLLKYFLVERPKRRASWR